MIVELRVRDLATVAEVTLSLGPGLNVLTGETGAGKSMIVDALALLLGARADLSAVRPGAVRAVVEGVFVPVPTGIRSLLADAGLDDAGDTLVVRREMAVEGRSRAWVNGGPTTIGMLAALGEHLVDLHGQYDTRSLVVSETQRDLLDAFSGALAESTAVGDAWAEAERRRGVEQELLRRSEEVKSRVDYLRHVVTEIDAARPRPGEDALLTAEARLLSQAGALTGLLGRLTSLVDEGESSVAHALGEAERIRQAIERIDPDAASWHELLDAAFVNLTELSRVIAEYAAAIEDNPDRLGEVERRRGVLARLTPKYGGTLEAVLETRRQAAEELELLDTAEVDLRRLSGERAEAEAALKARAAELSARRAAGARRLEKEVGRLLPRLGLAGGKLAVELEPLAKVGAHGAEHVRLMVRLNEGMEFRPLARSASGGEVSRLMLALKVVLAGHDRVPVLVFDEIDQGIGGEVGGQVGDALAAVAEQHQVLVITHLAQIAARAARHLVVSKQARGGLATSDVSEVAGEARVEEVARMLGDPEAETARRHARTLMTR